MKLASRAAAGLVVLTVFALSLNGSTVQAGPGPANDDFADALLITSLPYSDAIDITAATVEPSETTCTTVGHTVWYEFTPTSNLLMSVDTLGSSFGTAIAVYTGSSLNSLTNVICASSPGPVSRSFNAFAGVTYYLQVGGRDDESGLLSFNVDFVPPPAKGNDDLAAAIPIASLPFTNSDDLAGATHEIDEPLECARFGTAWYSFTPTVDSVLLFSAAVPGGTPRVKAYTGTKPNDLVPASGCFVVEDPELGPPRPVAFVARAGTTYHFQVGDSREVVSFTLDGLPCLPEGCPEMQLDVPSGNCDSPEGPTQCSVPLGSKFELAVDITAAPPQNYVLAQTWIDFGHDLEYLPDPPKSNTLTQHTTNEFDWPDCDPAIALRSQLSASSVLHGCISGITFPVHSDYIGRLLTLSFKCSSEESSTAVSLLPKGAPGTVTSGADFALPNGSIVAPEVDSLTINCTDEVAPAVGGVALDGGLSSIADEGGSNRAWWLAAGAAIVAMLAGVGALASWRLTIPARSVD